MTDTTQIVVLDGYTANPGDLSWESLEALGECVVHDRTDPDLVGYRIRTADVVLTNKVRLSAVEIEEAPLLKLIVVLATGFDVVDVAAARKRRIPVCNVPSYSTPSVAQWVFAHILHLTSHVGSHAHGVAAGKWSAAPDWCYWDQTPVELAGQVIGIVGLGEIGTMVARIAHGFGMRVQATTRTAQSGAHQLVGVPVQLVALDSLFATSDFVSLHCPLTTETENMVNAQRLALMKPTAVLVNTARGGLVDSRALAAALQAGQLAGAGLDVLDVEPPPRDHVLLGLPNCCITPHIAWATRATRQRLLTTAAKNVQRFLAGAPENVVNPW